MTVHRGMTVWDRRAGEAEAAVLHRFVGRYRHLPGTLLGRTVTPVRQGDRRVAVDGRAPFHYWWQAHLLDALVDGGFRRRRNNDTSGARRSARRAHQLLATIRLRNRGTLRNHFYDDMAWLTLAVERLAALDAQLGLRLAKMSLTPARRTLTRELWRSLHSAGGVVWNRDREYLNAATAGPIALHLAHTGFLAEARTIVEWVFERLCDPESGLIRDGVRSTGELVPHVYTYNQGTILGALLALGGPRDVERADHLVRAVGEHMVTDPRGSRILMTHGGGDGGLFTGILARHLGVAARDPRLSDGVRDEAAGLVRATGEVLWMKRDSTLGLFPVSGDERSGGPGPATVELSTQLQAWLVFEAAAGLDA